MKHILTAAVLVATLMTTSLSAQEVSPPCETKICVPEAYMKKEKKTVFKVECKEMCIPKIRLPWQMCQEPECGIVKKVLIMKKESKEVEKKAYKWKIVNAPPCDFGCQTGTLPIQNQVAAPGNLLPAQPIKLISGGVGSGMQNSQLFSKMPNMSEIVPRHRNDRR